MLPMNGARESAVETNLKAIVRYDGTNFDGWQVQPGRRTVQGVIEEALSRMASQPVRIHGAGRTDAGVHALGQVFSCRWPGEADPERLRRALSGMLGPEVRVERVEVVGPDFHARKSAVGKRYAYAFSLGREADPFSARYAWCVPWAVDLERLAELARRVEGEHDFAGFCGSGSAVKTTVRRVHSARLERGGFAGPRDAEGLWRLEFHGNGFLYKMVRNVTGTLMDIARGRVPESRLEEILGSPGPYHGHTAPGHGLALVEVEY
jgi:tRNA pseudouridine38-40 synthase